MTSGINLLLVEDDEMLGDGIQTVLERRGLAIDWGARRSQCHAVLEECPL